MTPILKYYKGQIGGRLGRILYFLSPSLYYMLFAHKIKIQAHSLDSYRMECEIEIKPMENSLLILQEIKQLFNDKNINNYTKLIVHGSVATSEIINYSDLDVLVIISDSAFKSGKQLAKITRTLQQSEKLLKKFDPLQHHGWFVLTDYDLNHYPETYFPLEILEHVRIFSQRGPAALNVKIPNNDMSWDVPFKRTAESLIRKLSNATYHPNEILSLKGLLSEFMLLPALYVQARNKKGISKKTSFATAKNDFDFKTWEIMELVSDIRKSWKYDMNRFQRYILTRSHPLVRRYAKYAAPRIPRELAHILQPGFYSRMKLLVIKMRRKLYEL